MKLTFEVSRIFQNDCIGVKIIQGNYESTELLFKENTGNYGKAPTPGGTYSTVIICWLLILIK